MSVTKALKCITFSVGQKDKGSVILTLHSAICGKFQQRLYYTCNEQVNKKKNYLKVKAIYYG